MEDEAATRFNKSFMRCMADRTFFDKFYALFTSASPQIRDKFKNTDFNRQKRMLEESLNAIVASSEQNGPSDDFLARLAQHHNQLKIDPAHYQIWEDCLLQTAAQCDPDFDDETKAAWRAVMKRGADIMKGIW